MLTGRDRWAAAAACGVCRRARARRCVTEGTMLQQGGGGGGVVDMEGIVCGAMMLVVLVLVILLVLVVVLVLVLVLVVVLVLVIDCIASNSC